MSRWRRRDPAVPDPGSESGSDPTGLDPDSTMELGAPERSWQPSASTGTAVGFGDDPTRRLDPYPDHDPDRETGIDPDLGDEPADGAEEYAEPTGEAGEYAGTSTEWWSAHTGADGVGDPDGTDGADDPDGPTPATAAGPWPVDARARSVQRASARAEILGRVRAAIGGRPAPEGDVPRGYRRSLDLGREDVVALFAERVADYKATVWPIMREQLAATIAVCLVERGIRRVAVPADLPASLLPQYVDVRVDNGELTGTDLDAVDGVITGCALGIAETGTIVLDGGRMQGRRLLSLVPDYHLCVVDTLDVVGSLPEALGRLDPARPLTFISGPSATSDIELDRVEGVHGPRTLDVLLTG